MNERMNERMSEGMNERHCRNVHYISQSRGKFYGPVRKMKGERGGFNSQIENSSSASRERKSSDYLSFGSYALSII